MNDFKNTEQLQELKRQLQHNEAKIKVGYKVSKSVISKLKKQISDIEKKLFSSPKA